MRLASGWIILRDKKILLIKRSDYTKAFPWYWTLPSWKQENNETAEENAIREVKEEVWLDFIPTKLFHNSVLENSWIEVHAHRFLWDWSWKITIQEKEVDWYAWYTYNEAIKLDLAFDYRKVIEKLYDEKFL